VHFLPGRFSRMKTRLRVPFPSSPRNDYTSSFSITMAIFSAGSTSSGNGHLLRVASHMGRILQRSPNQEEKAHREYAVMLDCWIPFTFGRG